MVVSRFKNVQVTRPDGSVSKARLEVIPVAMDLLAAQLTATVAGENWGVVLRKIVDVFAAHGLPGLSEPAAVELAVALADRAGLIARTARQVWKARVPKDLG